MFHPVAYQCSHPTFYLRARVTRINAAIRLFVYGVRLQRLSI
jgi:hypothetical protein